MCGLKSFVIEEAAVVCLSKMDNAMDTVKLYVAYC